MFDKLQDRIFRASLNRTFEIHLEKEFWMDLVYVMELCKIPFYDRSHDENWEIDFFKKLYPLDGTCQSKLYKKASKKLQRKYDLFHDLICSFLYD